MFPQSPELEPAPEDEASPGFWRRWYWPVVSLAALLAFELTASPTLSAILLCCHFGLDDALTGIWLWRTDPQRGRGRACAWFSFARAVTRTLAAAFVLLLVLVIVAAQIGRQQLRVPPAGFIGVMMLMSAGLPLATFLSLLGCLSARRHAVKVWLDPGLHESRRARQWPVSIQGLRNLADMPYLLMIAVLSTTGLTPLITALVLVFRNVPRLGFDMSLLGVVLILNVGVTGWQLLGWTNEARARLPSECWGDAPFQPAASLLDTDEQHEWWDTGENPDDPVDWDDGSRGFQHPSA